MKSIKILTIIFIVFFTVYPVFSQETVENNGSSVIDNDQGNTGIEGSAASVKEKAVSSDQINSGTKKLAEDTAKIGNSVKAVKKKPAIPEVQEEQAPVIDENTRGEDFLLPINEGNFKYKRIPDIKLPDRTPSMAEQNAQNINNASDGENSMDVSSGDGFFGLSKNTADIVAKGGILLLVLGIFILYRLRSRGGRRGSSTSVLKSYRK